MRNSKDIKLRKLLNEYPVDEFGNPNAGDAELWLLDDGTKLEIITWNYRAIEHEEGETTETLLNQ